MLRYRIAFFENDAATMERLARETPADDMTWLHLQMQLAFFRGDFTKLRSLSETLVQQQSRANRMENAANELAWHAGLESFLGEYASARKLCRQAGEVGNDSAVGLWTCAKALGDAGDVTQAEALAAKLDRLFPEDSFQQKVLLRLFVPSLSASEETLLKPLICSLQSRNTQMERFLIIAPKVTWLQESTPRLPPISGMSSITADGPSGSVCSAGATRSRTSLCHAGRPRENPQSLRRVLHDLEKRGPGYPDTPSSQS